MHANRTDRARKRGPFGAILIFGLVYLAALILIFAPEGSFDVRNVEVSQSP